MNLADKRLDHVLEAITDRISKKQTISMRKLSNERKEEIQFGRFIGNPRVSVEDLENLLYNQASNNCQASHVLLIEDTSQMSFGLNRSIEGLGKVDKGQVKGFYLHPVLSIDAENGTCYGIPSLEFHSREWKEEHRTRKELKSARNKIPFEEKEGYRWYSSIQKALPYCQSIKSKTVVADRESDIYSVLTGLKERLGIDYLIRSKHNRPLEAGGKLLEQINNWTKEFRVNIEVPATDKRSAHKANLILKFGHVTLKKAEGKSIKKYPEVHSTWVVEAKESLDSVINKEKPIHWILLTSHPVETSEMALQIVKWYKQRWNIEQVFRTLKNKGLRIEASQVSDYEKLQKLMILALMSAVKVLQLIRARDGKTEQLISLAFNNEEEKFIKVLNKSLEGKTEKLKNPYPEKNLAFAAWTIARLSGWSGYKSQRPAGPIDFLKGLQIFYERLQGYLLAEVT